MQIFFIFSQRYLLCKCNTGSINFNKFKNMDKICCYFNTNLHFSRLIYLKEWL